MDSIERLGSWATAHWKAIVTSIAGFLMFAGSITPDAFLENVFAWRDVFLIVDWESGLTWRLVAGGAGLLLLIASWAHPERWVPAKLPPLRLDKNTAVPADPAAMRQGVEWQLNQKNVPMPYCPIHHVRLLYKSNSLHHDHVQDVEHEMIIGPNPAHGHLWCSVEIEDADMGHAFKSEKQWRVGDEAVKVAPQLGVISWLEYPEE